MSPKSYHAFTPYRHKPPKYKMILSTSVLVVGFLGLFLFGLFWFRYRPIIPVQEKNGEMIKEAFTEIPFMDTTNIKKQIDLFSLPGKMGQGTALREREIESGLFLLTLQTQLPEIDTNTFFYEAWLVRSFPFDFFSVGTLEKNENGAFVLQWFGEKEKEQEYVTYDEVVVTLEKHDGNLGPSEHILEGSF